MALVTLCHSEFATNVQKEAVQNDVEAYQAKQAWKRGKAATMEDGATAAVEATNEDGDGNVAELWLSLAGLMQGQEKLREPIKLVR